MWLAKALLRSKIKSSLRNPKNSSSSASSSAASAEVIAGRLATFAAAPIWRGMWRVAEDAGTPVPGCVPRARDRACKVGR